MFAPIRDWIGRHLGGAEAIFLLIIVLASVLLVEFASHILAPLLASLVVAFLLQRVVDRLELLGCPHGIAVSLTTLLLIVLLYGSLLVMAPVVWRQFGALYDSLPRIQVAVVQLVAALDQSLGGVFGENAALQAGDFIQQQFRRWGGALIGSGFSTLSNIATVLIYLFLVPLMSHFLLQDKEQIMQWFRSHLLPARNERLEPIWHELKQQMGNYVQGKFTEILLVGLISYAVFIVNRLEYAALLAVAVGLSVVIPYVGAAIVTVPVLLLGYAQWGLNAPFFYLCAAYFLIQILDGNLLVPLLFSEAVSLHPVVIIMAVVVFGNLWGLLGGVLCHSSSHSVQDFAQRMAQSALACAVRLMSHAALLRPWQSVCGALAVCFMCAAPLSALAAAPVGKGASDPRDYHAMTLPGGLRALLVSDPDASRAAAALAVAAGSRNDPGARLGLAHFVEHMLFLGTDRYPKSGDYQQFITAHGGSYNAYTGFEHSNYFFEIDPEQLAGALDRFARFFIAPQLSELHVEREKQAVHAEFRAGIEHMARRQQDVLRGLLNPAHPRSRLAIGNLETLGSEGLSAAVAEFFRAHYTAGRMALVVVAPLPLEALQAMVRERFVGLAPGGGRQRDIREPLFNDDVLGRWVYVIPNREQRQLRLMFPVPDSYRHWRTKPLHYIAELLGHEGPGSALSQLRKRGWAVALSAGSGLRHRGGGSFEVVVDLSQEGLRRVEDVAELLFAAINLLRDTPPELWRFEEMSQLAALHFDYQDPQSPLGTALGLAARMHEYRARDALRGSYLMDRFRPRVIRRMLNALRADNCLLMLTAPELRVNVQSAYYDTPYGLFPISPPTLRRWDEASPADYALALPEPNPFIPERLALLPPSLDYQLGQPPLLLRYGRRFQMWFQQDSHFRRPYTDLMFAIRFPQAADTPAHSAMNELLARMLRDELNESTYAALLAGLHFTVRATLRGLTVDISGFQDRQDELLLRVLGVLRKPELATARFDVLRAELLREWRAVRRAAPHRRLAASLGQLLQRGAYTEEARIAALEQVDLATLRDFAGQVLKNNYIQGLAHGNLEALDAQRLAHWVQSAVGGDSGKQPLPPLATAHIDPSARPWVWERDFDHDDTAVLLYFQAPGESERNQAMSALVAHILHPLFFEELRTARQLGYVVYASYQRVAMLPGVSFVVQSPRAPAAEIEAQMRDFFRRQLSQMEQLSDEEFARQRDGLASKVLALPSSQRELSARYWGDIALGQTDFMRRERVAAELSAISRQQWLAFSRALLLAPQRREVLLRAPGNGPGGGSAARSLITSAASFKRAVKQWHLLN